ncbi:MAG: hypothetical protein ABI175_12580 [Polyangiales bacterium]
MRPRRPRPAFALLALALPAFVAFAFGCKSNEDTTARTSPPSGPTSAAPVSSAVARQQVQISLRTSEHLAALRDVFDGKGQVAALRAFFDPGVTGDGPATALFDRATKLGNEGWRVHRFEVRAIHVDAAGTSAAADVFEWLTRNEQGQCRSYTVPWSIREQGAYVGAAFDVREATCPAAR